MSTTSEEIKYARQPQHMEELSRQITLSISPEQYERLFFQPTPARGDLSKRLGNPTLLGLFGFLVPFQVTMLSLLEFRGASAASLAALCGSFYFFGGIAMVLAGIAEFILGNTFPMAVFIIFGCHWVQVGYNSDPSVNLVAGFGAEGALTPGWNSGNGMYSITLMCICAVFTIGTLRTNIPFLLTFICLIPLFACFAAAQWHISAYPTAAGVARALYLFKVAGGFGLVSCICGWYLAIIQVCASVGIPCPLPVMDLSQKLFKNTQAAADESAGAGGSAAARPIHAHDN